MIHEIKVCDSRGALIVQIIQFVPGDHYPTPPVLPVHIPSTQPPPISERSASMENSVIIKDQRPSWHQMKPILVLLLPHGPHEGLNSSIYVGNGASWLHPVQGL